mmetsp:Transcript_62711/g.93299  ORF Transcript_62711/g.93299 Transcript_62711/m.93299 type:complete len:246 (-) Transcript_62711:93-830(-)
MEVKLTIAQTKNPPLLHKENEGIWALALLELKPSHAYVTHRNSPVLHKLPLPSHPFGATPSSNPQQNKFVTSTTRVGSSAVIKLPAQSCGQFLQFSPSVQIPSPQLRVYRLQSRGQFRHVSPVPQMLLLLQLPPVPGIRVGCVGRAREGKDGLEGEGKEAGDGEEGLLGLFPEGEGGEGLLPPPPVLKMRSIVSLLLSKSVDMKVLSSPSFSAIFSTYRISLLSVCFFACTETCAIQIKKVVILR